MKFWSRILFISLTSTFLLVYFYFSDFIISASRLFFVPNLYPSPDFVPKWTSIDDSTCTPTYFESLDFYEPNIKRPDIFFVDGSCRNHLSPLQACAIESAILHNPGRSVALKTMGPNFQEGDELLDLMFNYDHFTFYAIDPIKRVAGTALQQWLQSGVWQSKMAQGNSINSLSTAFQFLELNFTGGIYLDLDVISLDEVFLFGGRTIVALEDRGNVGGSFLSENPKHHWISHEVLKLYASSSAWGTNYWTNKTKVLTSVLSHSTCGKLLYVNGGSCAKRLVSVLPENTIYTVNDVDDVDLLCNPQRRAEAQRGLRRSRAVALGNGKEFWTKVGECREGSMLQHLVSQHCPTIHRIMKENLSRNFWT